MKQPTPWSNNLNCNKDLFDDMFHSYGAKNQRSSGVSIVLQKCACEEFMVYGVVLDVRVIWVKI